MMPLWHINYSLSHTYTIIFSTKHFITNIKKLVNVRLKTAFSLFFPWVWFTLIILNSKGIKAFPIRHVISVFCHLSRTFCEFFRTQNYLKDIAVLRRNNLSGTKLKLSWKWPVIIKFLCCRRLKAMILEGEKNVFISKQLRLHSGYP